ncbi:MAG: hypothetical protein AB1715_05855, partial [Acidobacteriota bacterium]
LLENLDRVKAPPDFEQSVMAQLSLRKRTERQRRIAMRLSLAGAFASVLIVGVLLNVFVLPKRASLQQFQPVSADELVPVIETLDYGTEIRSRSWEPEAIYLLEQVSDTTLREIKY